MIAALTLALAQFDFPVGDVDGNAFRILALCQKARDQHGADLIVFPELALSGYPPEDLLQRPAFLDACHRALAQLAREIDGIAAIIGHPDTIGPVVYNAASLVRQGVVEATYRKRELPNYAVFDERRYFATGDRPFVFDLHGVSVGVTICEDLWFREPLAATVAAGAELVVVPNASPFETGKHHARDTMLERRFAESPVAMAYLNVVGGQDELVFDGGSVLVDGDGRLHDAACAFEEALLVTRFDVASRRFEPMIWCPERDDSDDSLMWRALVRATGDYVRKNGFSRVMLGLSGGIDSALVAAIACDALGPENVTGVRLPSRYTSTLSQDLAAEQAAMMGFRLETVPIESPFAGFLETLEAPLDGVDRGVTDENLQSRIRGAILMALSNARGHLVLTTGNKSEYAVGYATLYGDMCGAFAPIKDVYKMGVYALANYRNGLSPAIPQAVIDRAPSAELKPDQVDSDSLPPYAVLDAILDRHVDREMSRAEIIADGFDGELVDSIAAKVFNTEFKRRQSAPGPKVSRRAFGRERRYPITSAWR